MCERLREREREFNLLQPDTALLLALSLFLFCLVYVKSSDFFLFFSGLFIKSSFKVTHTLNLTSDFHLMDKH